MSIRDLELLDLGTITGRAEAWEILRKQWGTSYAMVSWILHTIETLHNKLAELEDKTVASLENDVAGLEDQLSQSEDDYKALDKERNDLELRVFQLQNEVTLLEKRLREAYA